MTLPVINASPAPGASWKGVRELERQFRLAHGQIRKWIKKGLIGPDAIQEPTKNSEKRLIDEATVNAVVIDEHRPRGPKYSRSVLIPSGTTGQPDRIIPPQLVAPSTPIIESAPQELPAGLVSTASLVSSYLHLRSLQVERNTIAARTYTIEAHYMRMWALHTPIFPWGPLDIDSYEAQLGSKRSRWHAIRYLKTLSLWAIERYPNAKLPMKFPIGSQKPPRHDVMTADQEQTILAALRDNQPQLWVYAIILDRTGCRSFELTDLDWEDITPQGFTTKGRAKKTAGTVYFPPGLYDFLTQHMPEPHTGPVFVNQHGLRYHPDRLAVKFRSTIDRVDHGYQGPIGSYMFRHLYAERIKNIIPIERAASIMRTSVQMLERTYGKHTDESYHTIINEVDHAIFADTPLPTSPPT